MPGLRICIVMEYHPHDYIGGSETQVFGLAKQFALAGNDVTYICQRYDASRPADETVDGVRVLRVLRWRRVFRFLAGPRVVRTVRRARPDVVYQRFASPYTGVAALAAKLAGAKFVWGCAEDASLGRSFRFGGPDKPSGGPGRRAKHALLRFDAGVTQRLFHWGLQQAGAVVVQNRSQQEALLANYGRTGHLIHNGISLGPGTTERPAEPLVLWLNRIGRRKNPESFVALAKALGPRFPEASFVLVGGRQNDGYQEEVRKAGADVPRLQMTGSVPPAEVPGWFDRAWIFVLTSLGEGFPNVLLQAWASGVPVVSLVVDPDDLIVNEGLGMLSLTQEGLERDVALLLGDAGLRGKLAKASRTYVAEHFEFAKVAQRYLELFDYLVRGDRPDSASR